MQFQPLSQSLGTSLPRDQFIIQALSSRAAEGSAAEGNEAGGRGLSSSYTADQADHDIGITADDQEEERQLRRRERQKRREKRESRSRRPSTLHSFITGSLGRGGGGSVIEEDEEGGGRAQDDLDDDDDESYLSSDEEDEDHTSTHPTDYGTTADDGAPSSSNNLLLPPTGDHTSPRKKPSHASLRSSGSLAVPASENTPLLKAGGASDAGAGAGASARRLSTATLTPKALRRFYRGKTVNASRKELTLLIYYMVPIFLTHILEYSLLLVTIVSVGHLGTAELAASSLGSMTINVCALSLVQGLCAALDTLCSQSYSSPNPKTTSLHALRTAVLTVIILIPATVAIYNGEKILLGLRQDPEVAHLAGRYLRILIFGLPGYAGFEISRRWLQAQGLMIIPTISLIIASPINVFLNWLLVWGPDNVRLGFIGAPISTAISFNLMFLFSMIYCVFFAPRTAWGGLTWDIFRDLRVNLVLGAAGFVSVASEWWAWEIVGICSAYLGTDMLAANSVLGSSCSLLYQLPYGLSVAASVRVGNLVGAQMPYVARTSAKMAWILSIVVGTMNSSILMLARNRWGGLFSSDERVIKIVASVMPLVGLFQLADGVTIAAMGILRGTGYATLGAQINLLAYWVIGLPIGLALTFSRLEWQLFGLWTGLTVALTFTAVLSSIVIYRIKWTETVKAVRANAEAVAEAAKADREAAEEVEGRDM